MSNKKDIEKAFLFQGIYTYSVCSFWKVIRLSKLGVDETTCSSYITINNNLVVEKHAMTSEVEEGVDMANMQIVVAGCKNVEAQYVEMKVPLYSYGCERKVNKALSHLKGIYSVNVDFEQQKVTVWGICNKYDVLATIKSKRKGTHFWNSDDQGNNNNEVEEEEDHNHKLPNSHPPSLSLIKFRRSFSWKALKKVFVRSNSF